MRAVPLTPDSPDTHEAPRLAAALVVSYERLQLPQIGAEPVQVPQRMRLDVIRVVDFYRDDEFRP